MTIYNSYQELNGNVLNSGDFLNFKFKNEIFKYEVYYRYLSGINASNSQIFDNILKENENKYDFCSEVYGYNAIKGGWPECKERDFKALTRLALAIYKRCDDNNYQNFKKLVRNV